MPTGSLDPIGRLGGLRVGSGGVGADADFPQVTYRPFRLLVAVLSPLLAVAQVEPGAGVPPVPGHVPGAAAAVVYWCAVGERVARARVEAASGAAMARRFAAAPVAFVAVVAAPGASAPAGFEVAVDADRASAAWFAADDPAFVVVVDRSGVARFVGEPGAGLVDAIDAVVAGRHDLEAARVAHASRRRSGRSLFDLRAPAVAPLHAALAHAPRDGQTRGMLYLVAAVGCRDEALADRLADEALDALADEPRALAAFLDLAARGEVRKAAFARRALTVALRAAAAAPDDVALQLATLRLQAHAGDHRAAGRRAVAVRRLARDDAAACLDFAAILAEGPDAAVNGDLAAIVVDRAEALGADPRALAAARYGALARCARDAAAAERLLEAYVAQRPAHVRDNNDCWRLLTDVRTMGRWTPFATAIAERIAADAAEVAYFEWDTVALAMFFAGRSDDAVACAERAVARAGAAGADYADRLRWYREAQAPTPR